MIPQLITHQSRQVAQKIQKLITFLRGYEESGVIGIDSISIETRSLLKEHNIL